MAVKPKSREKPLSLNRHRVAGRKQRVIADEIQPNKTLASKQEELAVVKANTMGRPTKITQGIVDKLRQAFAIDATVEEACFYAGINKTTYYNWTKAHPDLFNDLEQLRLTPILTARQTIMNAAKTDVNTAKWLLERKRKKEYTAGHQLLDDEGKAMPTPILNLVLNPPKPSDDTIREFVEGETEPEVSENTLLDQESQTGNIMDDIK